MSWRDWQHLEYNSLSWSLVCELHVCVHGNTSHGSHGPSQFNEFIRTASQSRFCMTTYVYSVLVAVTYVFVPAPATVIVEYTVVNANTWAFHRIESTDMLLLTTISSCGSWASAWYIYHSILANGHMSIFTHETHIDTQAVAASLDRHAECA